MLKARPPSPTGEGWDGGKKAKMRKSLSKPKIKKHL
jgi:hypothetical protein